MKEIGEEEGRKTWGESHQDKAGGGVGWERRPGWVSESKV